MNCMKHRRNPVLSLFALAVFLAGSVSPIPAMPAEQPHFYDPAERMPKPDLSQIVQIRFLTTTDFPPFNFLDGSGKLTGFHIDIARAICTELSLTDKCSIQALPWAELAGMIDRNEADAILAGMDVNLETRRHFTFTRPFLQFPARFVVRKANASAFSAEKGLAGLRIGVAARSAHEDMLRTYFPAARVVIYDRADWALEDLRDGKTDAVFGDGMRQAFWTSSAQAADCCSLAGEPYLAREYLGAGLTIAVSKSRPELAQALDHALRKIEASGQSTELYLRYFPISFF